MSPVAVCSLLTCLAAAGWSVWLLHQLRNWRMAFLTALLGLITLRLFLRSVVDLNPGVLPAWLVDLPVLVISLMSFAAVVQLGRLIRDMDHRTRTSSSDQVALRARSTSAVTSSGAGNSPRVATSRHSGSSRSASG